MDMKPVNSSNIEACGYDCEARKLTIRFKGGATHHYSDVPTELHEQMMAENEREGGSVGKFFHAQIRNKFESVRAEDEKGSVS